MNNTVVTLIAILVVLGGGYYLFTKTSGVVPVSTPTTTTASETASAPASAVAVSIQNFSFSPSTLTVKTGTTVTWTNNDSVAHTVTSDVAGPLNSPTIPPGQSFSYTFTAAGTVTYHCAPHPSMKGSIIVSE